MSFSRKDKSISIQVNETALKKAMEVYENIGLDLDTAVNMLLVQTMKQQSFPVALVKEEKKVEETPQIQPKQVQPAEVDFSHLSGDSALAELRKTSHIQETTKENASEINDDFGWIS
jgi:antitoxin component of RelBE/YafQ-DinJ toxin-antitoxin module